MHTNKIIVRPKGEKFWKNENKMSEVIEMLENCELGGKVDVYNSSIDSDRKIIIIKFKNNGVAERLCEKKIITLGELELTINEYKETNASNKQQKKEEKKEKQEKHEKANEAKNSLNNADVENSNKKKSSKNNNMMQKVNQNRNSSKRLIIIDGNNVGISYAKQFAEDKSFSFKGLQLAVEFLMKKGNKDIQIVLPNFRKNLTNKQYPTLEAEDKAKAIMESLENNKMLNWVPSSPYDDEFILNFAVELNAVVISNDKYKDFYANELINNHIKNHNVLNYAWMKDIFLIAEKPFGEKGPSLDEILSNKNQSCSKSGDSNKEKNNEKIRMKSGDENNKRETVSRNNNSNKNKKEDRKNQQTKIVILVKKIFYKYLNEKKSKIEEKFKIRLQFLGRKKIQNDQKNKSNIFSNEYSVSITSTVTKNAYACKNYVRTLNENLKGCFILVENEQEYRHAEKLVVKKCQNLNNANDDDECSSVNGDNDDEEKIILYFYKEKNRLEIMLTSIDKKYETRIKELKDKLRVKKDILKLSPDILNSVKEIKSDWEAEYSVVIELKEHENSVEFSYLEDDSNDMVQIRQLIEGLENEKKCIIRKIYPKKENFLALKYFEYEMKNRKFDMTSIEINKLKGFIFLKSNPNNIDSIYNEIKRILDDIDNNIQYRQIGCNLSLYKYIKENISSFLPRKKNVEIKLSKDLFKPFVQFESLCNKTKLTICFGDIVETNVEIIVNSVNAEMKHGGGVALAIAKKAGFNYIKDCNQLKKPLDSRKVYLTSSGNINCESILNVICPMYSSQLTNEELKLRYNLCLTKASEKKCKSIAFPLLGTGIFNWPIQFSLEALLDNLNEKYLKESSIENIYLVENSISTFNTILDYIKNSPNTNVRISLNLSAYWKVLSNEACVKKKQTSKKDLGKYWFWLDDSKTWQMFAPNIMKEINKHYLNNEMVFQLKIGGKDYQFDLNGKRQMNIKTKYTRDISDRMPVKETIKTESDEMDSDDEDEIDETDENDEEDRLVLLENYERELNESDFEYTILLVGHSKFIEGCSKGFIEKIVRLKYTDRIANHYLNEFSDEELSKNNFKTISEKTELTKNRVVIMQRDSFIELTGQVQEDVLRIKDELYKLILNKMKIEYPAYWDISIINDNILYSIVNLDSNKNKKEWSEIEKNFMKTMKQNKIVSIKRIQNEFIYKRYFFEKSYLKDKTKDNVNEDYLWHGTSNEDPAQIYSSNICGFDFNYPNEGKWGKGIYFARNASYCDQYAHINDKNTKEIFYCSVLLGDFVQLGPDSKLIKAPLKNEENNESYDSVKAVSSGSEIFIVYENQKAYPAYLVEYDTLP